ncbi:hypothetical protein LTR37_021245 [Vermiconidia calcicola]|uniref:Uncharacterized protein n=1 Tax=Vermiconidia calcicola TaxID=1690605 RepID=A0ACC3MAS1_9PEZI|nr:hypothetical protein LTR37_021245 [Vermiconidia calcicola]
MSIRLSSPFRRIRSNSFSSYRDTSKLTRLRIFLFHTSAGRVVIGTFIIWILAAAFCRHAFWRDPHSWFFDGKSAFKPGYTGYRREESRAFIAAADDPTTNVDVFKPQSNNEPVICASLVTVNRVTDEQYLSDTIGSLLAGLTTEERSAVNVRLLFANSSDVGPQAGHPDYNATWLRSIDSWGPYNVTEKQLELLEEYQHNNTYRKKWAFDYAYALEDCYNHTNAPYIAKIEDDTIFADGWLPKALDALAQARERQAVWLYLRLFYTEYLRGWDGDVDGWYANPVFVFVFAMVACLLAAVAVRRARQTWRPQMGSEAINLMNVLMWICIPALVVLLFMIGIDSLSPRHHGVVRMDAKGCCTQALVYPRHQVPHLVAALRERKPAPTDWMIEEWADELHLARYAVVPPLAQHVGLKSSAGMTKKYTRLTWAYEFEAQNAKILRKDHRKRGRGAIWRAEDDRPVVMPS